MSTLTTEKIFSGAAALLFCLAGCSSRERIMENSVYSPQTNEYIRTRKESLRAGKRQDLSVEYDHSMAEVVGKIGEITIPFKSSKDGKRWTATIQVPKYESLGAEKALRVYAKDSSGVSPVSNVHERVPASWLARGEDGKFPEVPGPNYNVYPITK